MAEADSTAGSSISYGLGFRLGCGSDSEHVLSLSTLAITGPAALRTGRKSENSENQEGNRLGRIQETLWSSRGIVQRLSPDNSLIMCIIIHTHFIGAHEKLLRAIF